MEISRDWLETGLWGNSAVEEVGGCFFRREAVWAKRGRCRASILWRLDYRLE